MMMTSKRFELPEANDPYTGNIDATNFGDACPQQAISLPTAVNTAQKELHSEIQRLLGRGDKLKPNEDCAILLQIAVSQLPAC